MVLIWHVKRDGNYCQILPKLSLISGPIPPIKINEGFRYLGRHYDFKMNLEQEKKDLLTKFSNLLNITTKLKIKPQLKLKILNRFITAQINFTLRLCNFGSTWIAENLDALSVKAIRHWIEAPISSCVSEWLIAPRNRGGLGIPSWKNKSERY